MPPNRQAALEKYRHAAATYDKGEVPAIQRARRRAIARLSLQPGDVVFDVGCGTGLSFPLIEEGIGAQGRIIGIDQSPEMLVIAGRRVQTHSWRNVTLIESPVEEASISGHADAVLFCFTHDLLQSRNALENVFEHSKQGGRVVAAGFKWGPWWNLPLNVRVWAYVRHAVTTFDGFGRPWRHLERFVSEMEVEQVWFGAFYFGWGVVDRKRL